MRRTLECERAAVLRPCEVERFTKPLLRRGLGESPSRARTGSEPWCLLRSSAASRLLFCLFLLWIPGCGDDSGEPESGAYPGPCESRVDNPASPTMEDLAIYTYEGRTVSIAHFIDGNPTFLERYSYDEEGRELRREQDDLHDGTVDSWTSQDYDTLGRPTYYESSSANDGQGMPGEVDSVIETTYDDANFTGTAEVRDADGSPRAIFYLSLDGDWNVTREERDTDADGVIDWHTSRTYDDAGNLLFEEGGTGVDGPLEIRVTYHRDDSGMLLQQDSDAMVDGTIESSVFYEYDIDGNLLSETSGQRVVTYSYECWQ